MKPRPCLYIYGHPLVRKRVVAGSLISLTAVALLLAAAAELLWG
jgi:hypothetical protein